MLIQPRFTRKKPFPLPLRYSSLRYEDEGGDDIIAFLSWKYSIILIRFDYINNVKKIFFDNVFHPQSTK